MGNPWTFIRGLIALILISRAVVPDEETWARWEAETRQRNIEYYAREKEAENEWLYP
jgi:hypothetical protein